MMMDQEGLCGYNLSLVAGLVWMILEIPFLLMQAEDLFIAQRKEMEG